MGHARLHAISGCHPVALWIDQPDAAYCFQCDHSLSLKPIALAARSHKHGYVVRGMPNCRDKCYVNALVQCLLALDELWMLMLGPHAPAGSLGLALKELLLETRAGNDAGATLNTEKLLKCIHELDEQYMTSDHQDCQEFLVHLREGLIEEELLKQPPDMQKDAPTVVDSIFKVEVSWTYERCLHTSDEGFYELPLTLLPEEHPIETAALPQKSGTYSRAELMNNLRQLGKQGKFACSCT
jgi:ubiquitin carboxyl-terminal hydrolase 16/45